MKKNGFTLVELIAVIAVLAVLITLSFGVYWNVQRNIMDSQYKNMKLYLETRAEAYAIDLRNNNPINVSVDYLIKEGYVKPDDDEYLYDPRDNSTKLNCYMINVIFENGQYIATFGDEEKNEEGVCDNTNLETGKVEIMCNGWRCDENKWYNDETLTLSIVGLSTDELSESKIEWTSLLGDHFSTLTIDLKINNVLNTTYSVTIKAKDGTTYRAGQNIKIDREAPYIYNLYLDNNTSSWLSENYLNFEVSDKSGSGGLSYAIIDNDDCSSATYEPSTENKYRIPLANGKKYYVCLKDEAGNITTSDSLITIDNIDPTDPEVEIILPTEWGKTALVKLNANDSESGIVAYRFDNEEWNYITSVKDLNTTYEVTTNGTHYVSVKNGAGKTITKEYEVTTVDTTEPLITTDYNSVAKSSSINIKIDLFDAESGVSSYQITKEYNEPTSWLPASESSINYTVTSNGEYYIWSKDKVDNISVVKIIINNINS